MLIAGSFFRKKPEDFWAFFRVDLTAGAGRLTVSFLPAVFLPRGQKDGTGDLFTFAVLFPGLLKRATWKGWIHSRALSSVG